MSADRLASLAFAFLPTSWRKGLGATRVLIAIACLGSLLASPPQARPVVALFGAYLIFSLATVAAKRFERGRQRLVALLVDAAFLLFYASQDALGAVWVAACFYVYLLVSATLAYYWRETLLVVGAFVVFVALTRWSLQEPLWLVAMAAGVPALVLSFQKKMLLEKLSAVMRQTVLLRDEAEKAREAERQRIAADLHDGPLQVFAAFQMRLDVARKLLERDPQGGVEELRQLREACHTQVSELRTFVKSMRPLEVDGTSLAGSISRLIQGFAKETGIATTFESRSPTGALPPEISREVLQIVRESLHNVQKHSGASRVAVAMDKIPDGLLISVEDDGRGFSFTGAYTLEELELLKLGPMSIKRRVEALGADMTLESRVGRGAGITLRIPV